MNKQFEIECYWDLELLNDVSEVGNENGMKGQQHRPNLTYVRIKSDTREKRPTMADS